MPGVAKRVAVYSALWWSERGKEGAVKMIHETCRTNRYSTQTFSIRLADSGLSSAIRLMSCSWAHGRVRERERDGISNSTINLHRSRAHESGELVRTQKPNPNRSLPMLPSGTSPFMNSSHVNGFAGFVAVRRACRKMNRASTMNFLSTIRDTRDTAVIQIKRTNLPVADDWKMI